MYNVGKSFYVKWACLIALALLVGVAICGCGGSGSATPVNYQGDGTSGIRGVVTAIESSSGTVTGTLANATVLAFLNPVNPNPLLGVASTEGPVVAQTQTDTQGNYSLALTPGNYIIRATSASVGSSSDIRDKGVTIPTHKFVNLNLVVYHGTP